MDLIYWGTSENCVPKVDLVEAGKMGKREDLRKFKEGQIVTAGQLGQTSSQSVGQVTLK